MKVTTNIPAPREVPIQTMSNGTKFKRFDDECVRVSGGYVVIDTGNIVTVPLPVQTGSFLHGYADPSLGELPAPGMISKTLAEVDEGSYFTRSGLTYLKTDENTYVGLVSGVEFDYNKGQGVLLPSTLVSVYPTGTTITLEV